MADLGIIECLIEPPDEVKSGADFLAEAVEALKAGRRDDAAAALQRLNAETYAAIWISGGTVAGARHHPDLHPPKHLGKAARTIPRAVRREVAERDGWRCRYCRLRLVSSDLLWGIHRELPMDLPWGQTAADCHPAWRVLRYTPDHVLSHAYGGTNEAQNLVAACGTCQFQKGDCSTAELRLIDPRHREPTVDGWDGLVGRFGPLKI